MRAASDPSGYVIPPRYWLWLGDRKTISLLLWIAVLLLAAFMLRRALNWFNVHESRPEHTRRISNIGHAQIDFGGQWVMGRMLVLGHGRELYHRQREWEVVQEGFPVEDEPLVIQLEAIEPGPSRKLAKPDDELKHDAERMMGWFMGSDAPEWRQAAGAITAPLGGSISGNPFLEAALQQTARDSITPAVVEKVTTPAIGGPLYPPVHAFFYLPIGMFDRPLQAYHFFQVIAAVSVFVAGLGVKALSRGRIWWSVATLVLLLYPGTRGGLDLGQNPTITLSIVIWGWALASRGYDFAGGLVWGLFAFKPVWALAFLIVPLLTGRWRFLLAMVLTGGGLVLATLPFVGIRTWFDWLEVGKEAAGIYNVNQNWINLSRDLHGIPRRMLHDFTAPMAERDTPLARSLAWALWSFVMAATVGIYLRFADRKRAVGIGAAFLFLGAFLTCYRFMYYDALISAAALSVLFAEPARFFRTRQFHLALVPVSPLSDPVVEAPERSTGRADRLGPRLIGYFNSFPLTILAGLLLAENSLNGMQIEATLGFGYFAHSGSGGGSALVTPKIIADTSYSYPWETAMLLALWGWCGWQLIRGNEKALPVEAVPTTPTEVQDEKQNGRAAS